MRGPRTKRIPTVTPREETRLTREQQLELARERLRLLIDSYIQAEAEVSALEEGAFRVVIFGSARIRPRDDVYWQVYRIAHALAERGIDVVTGGGPGLMEAANRAAQDVVGRPGRSYGLPIDIPTIQEPANRHLDIKSSHRRFSSRLDEFMRLSNAVVVAPGGIGTLLELAYVWQLLQVGVVNDRPVILLDRKLWSGLLTWMHDALLTQRYVSPGDFRWITTVDTPQEAIDLLILAHDRFTRAQLARDYGEADTDRSITADVVASGHPPTELTEEGVGTWEL
jgi:uncharacterized protein (TIGR00730 family)